MWLCVSITRKSTCTSLHLDSVRILKWHLTDSCLAFSCSTISFCSSVSPETFSILAYSLRILNVSLVVVSEAYENWPFGYLTDIFLFFFCKKGKIVSMLRLNVGFINSHQNWTYRLFSDSEACLLAILTHYNLISDAKDADPSEPPPFIKVWSIFVEWQMRASFV